MADAEGEQPAAEEVKAETGDVAGDAPPAEETAEEAAAPEAEQPVTEAPEAEAPAAEAAEAEAPAPEAEAEPAENAAEAGGETQEAAEGEEGAEKDKPEEGQEGDKEGEEEAIKEEGDEENKEEPVVQERAESPVAVGEKLSRGGTPEQSGSELAAVEARLDATTPDKLDGNSVLPSAHVQFDTQEPHDSVKNESVHITEEAAVQEESMAQVMEEEEEEEEEEEIVEPQFKREELIERYHEALADRETLQQQNYSLQHKLAEYFRKKKADERQDYDKNVTDQEQRYLKYMAQLEDLRRQDSVEKDNYRALIEDAKAKCQMRKETVDVERSKFMEFKTQVALKAVDSRSGKPIPPKDIEQYIINENKKEKEVVDVRLENIKLKNKLKKKEQQLKSKEELAEGLHLIDFEQLKIENQTYNEKIEERNEELLKLRKKITSTVQVLTHLKEKLQFVQGENADQSEQLKEVEASLAQSRDVLSRTKQARDALRIDNQRLRQSSGLLGNEPLLRDFEDRKDEGDDLKMKLDQLKMKHAELTLHCNQVRRKIDQTRATAT